MVMFVTEYWQIDMDPYLFTSLFNYLYIYSFMGI